MISPDATPIAHHAPLRPIDLRPVYQPAPTREHWEEQIDEMAWQAAVNRGERLWRVVVEFARTPGFIPKADAGERASDSLIESEGLFEGSRSIDYPDAYFEAIEWARLRARFQICAADIEREKAKQDEFDRAMESVQWTPEQLAQMNDDGNGG